MGEFGKRARNKSDNNDPRNSKRRATEKDKNKNNETVVYRILCPQNVIGSVIGKSGKVINLIRNETRSMIKVVDPFPGANERVITVYCHVKEKKDIMNAGDDVYDGELVCSAQEALMKLHDVIVNAVGVSSEESEIRKSVECRMLVPASQSSNVIGKGGATIKGIRRQTKANVKVIKKDAGDLTQSCARDFDNFVEITGDSEAVRRALYTVSAIMYKFPPKEEIPLDQSVSDIMPLIVPADLPVYPMPTSGFYLSRDSFNSPRSFPQIIGNASIPHVSGFRESSSVWPAYSSSLPLPIPSGFGPTSQAKELVVKLLCPFRHIGRVIGRGGSSVQSMREESGARIEVDDTKVDRDECMITVIATESLGDLKSMAVEALLLLQQKINGEENHSVSIRLLVPSKVIGCIIGKGGSIVTEIRKRTGADIQISKSNKPKCADAGDELVEVVGDVGCVRDAIVQIVLRLRDDVLGDKDSVHIPSSDRESVYSRSTNLPLPTIPQQAKANYYPQSEINSTRGSYSSSGQYRYEPYPIGEKSHGSLSSYSPKLYAGFSNPSTVELLIPSDAVGKVIGKGGANLSTIRKISGANVEISESISSRGDRMALISGTPEQKRSAENLIQAFIMAV